MTKYPSHIGVVDATFEDKEVQTDIARFEPGSEKSLTENKDASVKACRSIEECLKIYNDTNLGGAVLSDDEIILLVQNKHIPAYQIEKAVDDPERGVGIRRKILTVDGKLSGALTDLPYRNYDYGKVCSVNFNSIIIVLCLSLGNGGVL